MLGCTGLLGLLETRPHFPNYSVHTSVKRLHWLSAPARLGWFLTESLYELFWGKLLLLINLAEGHSFMALNDQLHLITSVLISVGHSCLRKGNFCLTHALGL